MWTYRQTDGAVLRNGRLIAHGYSGHGEGMNNPAMQDRPEVGPIPTGRYGIGAPHDHPRLGKQAMALTPEAGNDCCGRDGFYVHGDSIREPGTASRGCIILDPGTRKLIWSSLDHTLEVV